MRSDTGRRLSLENTDAARAMGTVFVLNVTDDGGAFHVHADGIAPGQTLSDVAPSAADTAPKGEYMESLGSAMTDALVTTGLYRDEAVGMVNTWKRQWFATPGIRVLYMLPQALTDRMIPIHIEPPPREMVRTVVIRVEVITPELEAADVSAAELLGTARAPEAERHFEDLGRFAEPRLRRALSLVGNPPTGADLLSRIARSGLTVSTGE